MWIELGTLVISTLLSVAGVGLPQMSVSPTATPIAYCAAQTAESCLEVDACDVFIGASGAETCSTACDMRDLGTCTMDTNCAVVDGACDYADYSPVGC